MASQFEEQLLRGFCHSLGYLATPEMPEAKTSAHGVRDGVHPMTRLREERKRKAEAGDAEAAKVIKLEEISKMYYSGARQGEKLAQRSKADSGDEQARVWLRDRGLYKRQWRKWGVPSIGVTTAYGLSSTKVVASGAVLSYARAEGLNDVRAETLKTRDAAGARSVISRAGIDESSGRETAGKNEALESIENDTMRESLQEAEHAGWKRTIDDLTTPVSQVANAVTKKEDQGNDEDELEVRLRLEEVRLELKLRRLRKK